MNIIATAGRMAAFDLRLFRRHPRFLSSCLAILFVPALYALIYLSSMWDPASHTRALTVALVNDDPGMDYQGRHIALGDEVIAGLEAQGTFGYRRLQQADEARQAVREGRAAFAVLIPSDFSRLAVPGEQPGAGRLTIYTSEGNNYTGAGFAKRFAPELSHRVNQALNTQRWAVVLKTAVGSVDSVEQLRTGVAQLVDGAGALSTGLGQAQGGAHAIASGSQQLAQGTDTLQSGLQELRTASTQLTGGMKQLGQGVREMNARTPAAADLRTLREGSSQLVAGQAALGKGLAELQQGAGTLREGTARFGAEAGKVLIAGDKLAAGAAQLEAGAARLQTGLGEARGAATQLSAGATRLDQGVGALTEGMGRLGEGLSKMSAALPEDRQLEAYVMGVDKAASGAGDLHQGAQKLAGATAQLDTGLGRLGEGSQRLKAGLDLLASKLPADLKSPTGSATGLAESVQPYIEVAAPVPNQGTAFAPNFVPLSLWIGATLTTFLFALRRLPEPLVDGSRLGLVLGKLTVPGLLVCGQVLVMLAMLFGVLELQVAQVPRFAVTLFVTGIVFLAIIFSLVRMLGDAGKVVAMLLLILQMAGAGATMPIELANRFFLAVHPWLPLTWVVRAMRVTMFDAYDGAWVMALGKVVLAGAVAVTLAALVGRWKVVAPEAYQPAMDMD